MLISQLLDLCLRRIRTYWYADRGREFYRDQTALIRAISLYGAECQTRGWDLEPEAICTDLLGLLNQVHSQSSDPAYLPAYLSGAVRRHVGLRAEEIAERAAGTAVVVKKVIDGLNRVEVIREPSGSAVLARVYEDLRRRQRERRGARRGARNARQGMLL